MAVVISERSQARAAAIWEAVAKAKRARDSRGEAEVVFRVPECARRGLTLCVMLPSEDAASA